MVASELTARFEQELLPDQFEAIRRRHPLAIGAPGDVANAVAFLLAETGR
jgi:NAD(P)-dependent dehydrogenase (short-subunit alcohol dehydrogenase family)